MNISSLAISFRSAMRHFFVSLVSFPDSSGLNLAPLNPGPIPWFQRKLSPKNAEFNMLTYFQSRFTPNPLCICYLLILLSFPFSSFAQMLQLKDFGPNPGELKAYLHLPPDTTSYLPLVIAMHGCLQDANTYAKETGWNDIADREGFAVLYPEQVQSNNPNKCFSWFLEGDINRDQGETRSIRSMIDQVSKKYKIDQERLFVSGLSAGGAMTAVMMATYPELFRSGAVIAGIPYKASTTLEGALTAMKGEIDQEPDQWEQLVIEQNPSYEGEYPDLVVFHGAEDPVVNRRNMLELAEQWMALHQIPKEEAQVDEAFDGNPDVIRRLYQRPDGKARVATFEVKKLGHALAVNPGTGPKQGGSTGRFSVDADFFVTYWAADFFGLIQEKE